MTLTQLIAVWDLLHVKDTGEIGFCDLQNALEEVGVVVGNDVPGCQPVYKDSTFTDLNTFGKIAICLFGAAVACGLFYVLESFYYIWR